MGLFIYDTVMIRSVNIHAQRTSAINSCLTLFYYHDYIDHADISIFYNHVLLMM